MVRNPTGDLPRVFVGSEAVAEGLLTAKQLRGPYVRRILTGVYAPIWVQRTHALKCEGAALVLPKEAVITGRSAATIRGADLAFYEDPVEIIADPDLRVSRRWGIDLRRTEIALHERTPWNGAGLASAERMALDLLLDRPLPEAVADLDVVLRRGLVSADALARMLPRRRDHGIVQARKALALSDPRAESRPESMVRVWLALDNLFPDLQVWIHNEAGRLACVDLAFEDLKIAIEYDGDWKNDRWVLNRDRARLNAVYAAGWHVVFVTKEMLRNPKLMVATVRAAIAMRLAA